MKEEYLKRINLVLNYIEENLESDLSLENISRIAFYSPFHLHRLFKAITNESLNAYIIRKRIESAAMELILKKEIPVSEIAAKKGFTSNSVFTRTFHKIYGKSPTKFRKDHPDLFGSIKQINSKNGKADFISSEYIRNIADLKKWMNEHAKIEIKELPKMQLVYITQVGVSGLLNAFYKIVQWTKKIGLFKRGESNLVRMFHDSFRITATEKIRMSIGVVMNEEVEPEGEIGFMRTEGGKHIVGRFEIEPMGQEFEKSWDGLVLWMSENGYKKAEKNPFEIYYNDYNEHPEKKCIVDLCIPVE